MILIPDAPRRARRPNLTPMIDVVFLLLVFFMLVSRFGAEAVIGLGLGTGDGADWKGPPRLVAVGADSLSVNGVAVPDAGTLPVVLMPLMQTPDDPIVLRAADGVAVQRLVDVISALQGAGLGTLLLAE